jgi:LysM repeat protein
MGQLEKYALYVLCLVIFLIFGVAVFSDTPPTKRTGAELSTQAPGGNGQGGGAPNSNTASVQDMLSGARKGDAAKPADAGKSGDSKPGDSKAKAGPTDGDLRSADAGQGGANKGPKAAEGATPAATAERPSHTVAAGDTYTSIAKGHFGSQALVGEIARLNPAVNPAKLQPGQVLLLPTKAEADRLLAPKAPAAPAGETKVPAPATAKLGAQPVTPTAPTAPASKAAPRVYLVAKDDTLESIAHSQLGSRKRVDELRQLNPDVDPTRMRVGLAIRLPKK